MKLDNELLLQHWLDFLYRSWQISSLGSPVPQNLRHDSNRFLPNDKLSVSCAKGLPLDFMFCIFCLGPRGLINVAWHSLWIARLTAVQHLNSTAQISLNMSRTRCDWWSARRSHYTATQLFKDLDHDLIINCWHNSNVQHFSQTNKVISSFTHASTFLLFPIYFSQFSPLMSSKDGRVRGGLLVLAYSGIIPLQ